MLDPAAFVGWKPTSRPAGSPSYLVGLGDDKEGYRAEFIDLARTAQKLSGGK